MNRTERRSDRRARQGGYLRGERPKGHPTPRNTPGEMTRARFNALQTRRVDRMLKETTIGRALETMLGAKRGEREAIEKLTRESGGILLRKR